MINRGRIVGDVYLRGGDDTFVFAKGGVLTGELDLGAGDDVAVIANGPVEPDCELRGRRLERRRHRRIGILLSYDELTDHIISQNNTDVVIALDGNDTLVLANLTGVLDALDFWFA